MLSMTQAEIFSECLAVPESPLNFSHLADPIGYLSDLSSKDHRQPAISPQPATPSVP